MKCEPNMQRLKQLLGEENREFTHSERLGAALRVQDTIRCNPTFKFFPIRCVCSYHLDLYSWLWPELSRKDCTWLMLHQPPPWFIFLFNEEYSKTGWKCAEQTHHSGTREYIKLPRHLVLFFIVGHEDWVHEPPRKNNVLIQVFGHQLLKLTRRNFELFSRC